MNKSISVKIVFFYVFSSELGQISGAGVGKSCAGGKRKVYSRRVVVGVVCVAVLRISCKDPLLRLRCWLAHIDD